MYLKLRLLYKHKNANHQNITKLRRIKKQRNWQ